MVKKEYTKGLDDMKKNSNVRGVHSYDGYTYVVVENGEIIQGEVVDFSGRSIAVYKLDKNYNPILKTVYEYPKNGVIREYSFYKNRMFLLSLNANEEYYMANAVLD